MRNYLTNTIGNFKAKAIRFISASTIFGVLVLILLGVTAYLEQARTVRAYSFMHDLVDYANHFGHLPESVFTFCDWQQKEKQRGWDYETTTNKVGFQWLSSDFIFSNNAPLILVHDQRLKKHEEALNAQITGRIWPHNLRRKPLSDQFDNQHSESLD